MSVEQIVKEIPAEEWAATPESVRQFVLALMQINGELRKRIEKLEERLNQNSQNSSKPPSLDGPGKAVGRSKEKSGRGCGGQAGHEGHTRLLKASEEVDHLIDVRPISCEGCGSLLLGDDPCAERHQVTEVPRVVAEITEYRRHSLCCMACGAVTTAQWPDEMPGGSFGPRTQAVVGYLSGRMSLSQRDIAEGMAALYHVEMAVGTISAIQAGVSAALAKPVEAAQQYIQQQPAVNLDETGWRQENKRVWLWLAATPLVAIFLVLKSRGAQGVRSLLGETFNGIVGSDRWSATTGWTPNAANSVGRICSGTSRNS